MRAMPKTLGTQGFSGLREEVVRSQGSSSRKPVLQEIIAYGISVVQTTLAVCPRISLSENSPIEKSQSSQAWGLFFCSCRSLYLFTLL